MVHRNAVKVQNIRMQEAISYAEAAKKVKQTESLQGKWPVIITNHTNRTSAQQRTNKDCLNVGKVECMSFLAEVINCVAQTESRTERIKIIKAAEKHLQVEGITLEQVHEKLKGQVADTQASYGGT